MDWIRLNGLKWTKIDQKDLTGPKLTKLNWSGPNEPKWIELDQMDWSGLECYANVVQNGPNGLKLIKIDQKDQSGSKLTEMDWMNQNKSN